MPNYSGSWTRTQQMQAVAASNWPSPPLPLTAFNYLLVGNLFLD